MTELEILNLEKSYDEDYNKAIEQAKKDGLIVCFSADNDNLDGVLMETSGRCITPSRLPYINSTSYKFPDDKVYHFGLDYRSLFNDDYTDLSTIKCHDFQAFVDELAQLLDENDVIMETWKYKSSFIAPRPDCVLEDEEIKMKIYELKDMDEEQKRKMREVEAKIYNLAYQHLSWHNKLLTSSWANNSADGLARDIAAMEERNVYQSNFSKYLNDIIEKGERDDVSLFKIIEEYAQNDKKLEKILKDDAIFNIMQYALVIIASNINVINDDENYAGAIDKNNRTRMILSKIGTYTDDLYRSHGKSCVTIAEMKKFIADTASAYVGEDYYSKLPNNTESDNTQKVRKMK